MDRLKKILTVPTPLWAVALVIIVFCTLTVGVAWSVRSTVEGERKAGIFGKISMRLAEIPTRLQIATYRFLPNELKEFTGLKTKYHRVVASPRKTADTSGYDVIANTLNARMDGLIMRHDAAKTQVGWRLLVGAFGIDGGTESAALLLSPSNEIVQKWILHRGDVVGGTENRDLIRTAHGLEMLEDGSLIYALTGGGPLNKIDRCGNQSWSLNGNYHHAVTLDDDERSVWTLDGPDSVARVSVDDGMVTNRFSIHDVIARNPEKFVLRIMQKHPKGQITSAEAAWRFNPFHFNDIDPLPASIAADFDSFSAGDLLFSARSLNAVFVVDPKSLQLKWWRAGAVHRQHDPDWVDGGKISVLNNRAGAPHSQILSLDPRTFETTVTFDGKTNDFYTFIRGKHQVLANGGLVITSPEQGRAFEVDAAGDVVLEILTTDPDDARQTFVLTEMRWFPEDKFKMDRVLCPESAVERAN